jgi:hypothetical protein
MINVLVAPYKSIEVETEEDGNQIISEGNKISFITDPDGEVKEGIVTGFKGSKADKVEVEIIPSGAGHKEIWKVIDMVEGSLKLVEGTDEDEE